MILNEDNIVILNENNAVIYTFLYFVSKGGATVQSIQAQEKNYSTFCSSISIFDKAVTTGFEQEEQFS